MSKPPPTATTVPAKPPRWYHGWWSGAQALRSPNEGQRPAGATVDLVVLHSISLPPGKFGGDQITQLFTNRLDWAAHRYFEQIRGLKVSAHFLIRRDGRLLQYVSGDRRAWHAGVSAWHGRDNCNDFSIGIELEGLECGEFEPAQYAALPLLLKALARRYPLQAITGHQHIAPGRKLDPGPGFSWAALVRQSGFPAHLRVDI